MAYTVKVLRCSLDDIASSIKSYLDTESPTNIHGINIVRQASIYRVIITTS